MINQVDEQDIVDELKGVDKACLYDQIKKITDHKTNLDANQLLKIKTLLLNELKNRKLLSVKVPSPKEGVGFYETGLLSFLTGDQIDTIMKRCAYVRDEVRCRVDQGGKLSFIE
jgi:hypothetical protein